MVDKWPAVDHHSLNILVNQNYNPGSWASREGCIFYNKGCAHFLDLNGQLFLFLILQDQNLKWLDWNHVTFETVIQEQHFSPSLMPCWSLFTVSLLVTSQPGEKQKREVACVDHPYIPQTQRTKLPFFLKCVERSGHNRCAAVALQCLEPRAFWVEQKLNSCLLWEGLLPLSFKRAALVTLMTLITLSFSCWSNCSLGDPWDWPH